MTIYQVYVKPTRESEWEDKPWAVYLSEDEAMITQSELLNDHWGVNVTKLNADNQICGDHNVFQNGYTHSNVDWHPGEKVCPVHNVEYRSQLGSRIDIHGICDECIRSPNPR